MLYSRTLLSISSKWNHPHLLTSNSWSTFFFFLFRAAPVAYGSFQVRGPIRAAAAGLHHRRTTWDLSRICNLHHSSWKCWIPDPLRKARDRTHILMDARFVSTAPQQGLSLGLLNAKIIKVQVGILLVSVTTYICK